VKKSGGRRETLSFWKGRVENSGQTVPRLARR
jgi:hypothetical protein